MLCIAECGGFLNLNEEIDGFQMEGALPSVCRNTGRLTRFGYLTMTAKEDNLFCTAGGQIRVHEFHYYDCTKNGTGFYAEKANERSWEAVVIGKTLYVGFPHLHFYTNPTFAGSFYQACIERKKQDAVSKTRRIETRSFAIISEKLAGWELPAENELVIKRVIRTTADFDYAENLCFSDRAVAQGITALRAGCGIITDTQMAKAGINKTVLTRLGGEVHCFMSDPDVAQEAKECGVTRAVASMERAAKLKKS